MKATIKNYALSIMHCALCLLAVMFVSCSNDDDPESKPVEPVYGATGLYILNEGNYYSEINGSLSFLDYATDELTDGIFKAANGRSLGGTPNDMVEVDNRLYICCTDENRVEVIDAQSRKSITYIEIPQPREICSSEEGIFVSSYDGTVYFLNFDGKIMAQSEKVGSCLEGIAVSNGYVYVCNAYNADYTYNANVVKLQELNLKKVKDITVAANPTQIECDGGLVYVLSTGNYTDVQGQIQSIDANDNVKYLCDATLMAVDENTIYAINSVTNWITYKTANEYFRVDGTTGTKTSILSSTDTQDIFSPCGIAYDSYNGMLYISSYSAGSSGYADYSGKGFIMSFNSNGTFVKKYDAGVGPTVMLAHVEQVK